MDTVANNLDLKDLAKRQVTAKVPIRLQDRLIQAVWKDQNRARLEM